jgi:hypothetical protein
MFYVDLKFPFAALKKYEFLKEHLSIQLKENFYTI